MMDWFPWYPTAHKRKTYRVSLVEDGALRRLIDQYMTDRGPLPDDDGALARIVGVSLDQWLIVSVGVRAYFRAHDGQLSNKRCDDELRAQDTRAQRYSERGKKAAYAKYSAPNALTARRMHVPATRHNTTNNTYTSQPVNSAPLRVGESRSLNQIVREKGWIADAPD
jgi:uncharacterized protein YdaU (DUF1376 family)